MRRRSGSLASSVARFTATPRPSWRSRAAITSLAPVTVSVGPSSKRSSSESPIVGFGSLFSTSHSRLRQGVREEGASSARITG